MAYETLGFWKIHNAVRFCPKVLKFFLKASLNESFIWKRFQVKIPEIEFGLKTGVLQEQFSKSSVSRQK